MTYYQFVQAVEMKIKEVINEDISVSLYTADKNNGVKRQGISIVQKENNISPTIYLEEYYEKYQRGYTIEELVEDIMHLYQEVRLPKSWDNFHIDVFEEVENSIVYRLINFEENIKILEDIPHMQYLDLAIIFYVLVEFNDYGTACMMIRNEHLEMWNVTRKDVYERAKNNTWRLLPAEFHTMRDILKEYAGEEVYVQNDTLYVVTNKIRSFGATVILYEGCLEMIGDILKDNYYVLPSSIHEVIVIAEKDASWGRTGLSEMVAEINRTQVDTEDVLSDCAYYYDREKKKLM